MEVICMAGVALKFILARIYEKASGRTKGNSYTSGISSAGYRTSNVTSSK